MQIIEVTGDEYNEAVKEHSIVYTKTAFGMLNKDKADRVVFLLFKDTKYKIGLMAGIKGTYLHAPFSAPFAIFEQTKKQVSIDDYHECVSLLVGYAKNISLSAVKLTLPPGIYGEDNVAKMSNALFCNGFTIENIDVNYHLDLKKAFENHYIEKLESSARNKLNIAQKSGIEFVICQTNEQKTLAYDIIALNRKAKGYPLHMSKEQVLATTEIIESEYFLVYSSDSAIATAIVFHVAPKIAQVIYWGDDPDAAAVKPMNFISYHVFKHYYEKGFDYVDIGPSTSNSTPNFGLCRFKSNIGCRESIKMSFCKLV